MRREYECWSCGGKGTEYGETCLTCGGTGDEPPPDTCDVCECAMKHKRLGEHRASTLFVCDGCRDAGMKQLGNGIVTALHVGIKR